MLFSWWRNRRLRQLLAQPFPEAWLDILAANVRFYETLSEQEQAILRDDLRLFVAAKDWEGCRGLEMTDEVQVTIAAQACLLTLALPEDMYRRVQTILVYPSEYLVPAQHPLGNLWLEGTSPVLGQAHYRGPVILSWDEVLEGGRYPERGHNLVFHEFAHQLDMLDGSVNGTPPLRDRQQEERWHRIMTAEFRRLRKASAFGVPALLDDYGAQDEGEFFAVATECFFTQALAMQEEHRQLYDLFREFYQQDPARRA